MRLSGQNSFIRSIRVRYLSGLFLLAITCGAIIFAMNHVNSFRHEVDRTASGFAALTRDLRKAEVFARQATSNWRADTRADLSSAAHGHVERLTAAIEKLDKRLTALRPRLSASTERSPSSSPWIR